MCARLCYINTRAEQSRSQTNRQTDRHVVLFLYFYVTRSYRKTGLEEVVNSLLWFLCGGEGRQRERDRQQNVSWGALLLLSVLCLLANKTYEVSKQIGPACVLWGEDVG